MAQARDPNSSDVLASLAAVQRRQGKRREALANYQRAAELNPRSEDMADLVAATEIYLRDYPEALRYYDRAIVLAPDAAWLYAGKIRAYLRWQGDTTKARAVVREAIAKVGLEKLVPSLFSASPGYEFFVALAEVPQNTLAQLSLSAFEVDTVGYRSFKGQLFLLQHQPALARVYVDSARLLLESKVKHRPADDGFHNGLGFNYTLLGRQADAIREGETAVGLLPVSKDALDGTWDLVNLAEDYAMAGKPDAAIDRLEYLLSIPSLVSIPLLRIDPIWDPLRDNPRFRRLVGGKQ